MFRWRITIGPLPTSAATVLLSGEEENLNLVGDLNAKSLKRQGIALSASFHNAHRWCL